MGRNQNGQEQANASRTLPRRNSGSMFAAFFVLSILAGLVVAGIMMGKRQKASQSKDIETALPEKVDPFEGMTYSDDKRSLKGGGSQGIFSGFESDAKLWVVAREAFEQADKLIVESAQLRDKGDASWRVLSAEAKGYCEEAVQRGAVWRKSLVQEVGEDSSEVRRLDKTLQKWRRTSMILHKTVAR